MEVDVDMQGNEVVGEEISLYGVMLENEKELVDRELYIGIG